MQNWFKKKVYPTCNYAKKAKEISLGLATLFVLWGTINEAEAQNIESYTKNGKAVFVLTKTAPNDQRNIHDGAMGNPTWGDLFKINTSTGAYERIDLAVDNEVAQTGAVQLIYLGSGANQLPGIEIPLETFKTLAQGEVYSLKMQTYYNGSGTIGRQNSPVFIFFSKWADNTISVHAVSIRREVGGQGIQRLYPSERRNNRPDYIVWSHNDANAAVNRTLYKVPKGQWQNLDAGLQATAAKGIVKLIAKDGTELLVTTKNLVFDQTANAYIQNLQAVPEYNNGIKQYQDNNSKLDVISTEFGNNGDGKAHFPWFDKIITNPANPYATPKFGTPSMSTVDEYRSTATVPVTGIDRSPASGVAVRSTNASGQSTPGSFNTSNNQATFANLAVAPDKLSEKYTLEVQWGKADYTKTEKTSVIIDNKAAPVWTAIPDVSLSQEESKTINLNDYANFKGNTLFEADGQLPAGVTILNGVVTVSSAAQAQNQTVIKFKAYRNLSQGGKSAVSSSSFKLTITEKITTQSNAAVSPQILSVSNEITIDNAWNIYDSYHLYKASGIRLNDSPVKTGKIALPGKIDLSGLEAGTYSLYLFHSKTGSGKGVIVIKK